MSLITINITNSMSIKNAWKKSFWWDKTAYCLSFILPLCRLLLTCIYNKEIYLIIDSSDIPAILVFGLSVSCKLASWCVSCVVMSTLVTIIQFSALVAHFVRGKGGAEVLVMGGFRFRKNYESNQRVRWRCTTHAKFNCKAAVYTEGSKIYSYNIRHTFPLELTRTRQY